MCNNKRRRRCWLTRSPRVPRKESRCVLRTYSGGWTRAVKNNSYSQDHHQGTPTLLTEKTQNCRLKEASRTACSTRDSCRRESLSRRPSWSSTRKARRSQLRDSLLTRCAWLLPYHRKNRRVSVELPCNKSSSHLTPTTKKRHLSHKS